MNRPCRLPLPPVAGAAPVRPARAAVRRFCRLLALCLLLLPGPAGGVIVPDPPPLSSRAHILIDHDSGRMLAGHAVDEQLAPASLTKLMTLYVVAEELAAGQVSMDDQVTVSENAWRTGGSRMFIEVGETVTVRVLLRGLIIPSGNDASVALAEHVAGSEAVFASLMNQHAGQLGMSNSHFVNSSGLPDPDHHASVRDLALLGRALIARHPQLYSWHAEKTFQHAGITQRNRNRLLWLDDSVDGIKTGHTEDAGYCLIASARRGDMRLVSVVMGMSGESARVQASQALLNYGFRFYETGVLQRAGAPVQAARLWQGRDRTIELGLSDDLVLTWPRGARDELHSTVSLDERRIMAPVRAGQRLGELRVAHGGEMLAARPLVALQDAPRGGLWRRLTDRLRLLTPGGE